MHQSQEQYTIMTAFRQLLATLPEETIVHVGSRLPGSECKELKKHLCEEDMRPGSLHVPSEDYGREDGWRNPS